jgi:hypothetical protein
MEFLAKKNMRVIPFVWVVSGKSKGKKKCELSYHLTLSLNFKFGGRSKGQRVLGHGLTQINSDKNPPSFTAETQGCCRTQAALRPGLSGKKS